ncbi:MAG: hypothetical protein J0M02_03220 [Planctomycetes bacterium]|nr:hypothetical protein [Planctomycetota bacterium]
MRSVPIITLLLALAMPLLASEDLPVSVTVRKEPKLSGYALQVTNQSVGRVRVLVVALNKTLEHTIDAKETWEVNHMDGFPFEENDTMEITIGAQTHHYRIVKGRIDRTANDVQDK